MALERKRIGGGKPGTPEQVSRSGLAAGKLQPLGGRGGCTVSTPASTLGKSQPRSGRKSPVGAESVLGAGERRNAGEQLSAIEPDGTPSLGASPGAVRQLQPLDVRSDEAPMGAVLRRNAISSLPSLTCPGAQHASSRSLAPMRVEEEIEAVVEPVEGTSLTDRDRKRAAACLKRSKLISDLSSVNLYEVSKLLRTVDFEAGMKARRARAPVAAHCWLGRALLAWPRAAGLAARSRIASPARPPPPLRARPPHAGCHVWRHRRLLLRDRRWRVGRVRGGGGRYDA